MQNPRVDKEAMFLTSTIWAKSLTKIITKVQDFKRVLDLNGK